MRRAKIEGSERKGVYRFYALTNVLHFCLKVLNPIQVHLHDIIDVHRHLSNSR